ncbi:ankyrin repeat domain-containing protein 27 [Aplysia californica]|uniref:Ankyrin repeat domain-containing protein 27 n=1 Tax=Aplysia californica TaxID=6500 RepID=A0ABM0K5R9_APLCA|nr:ankyrin repeat domain-containing protein 27 [Aplysia californica]
MRQVSHGQQNVVRTLLRNKCDVNLKVVVDVEDYAVKMKPYVKQDRLKLTCVYPCIVKDDVEMVRLLVSGGLDVNLRDERGCSPLWHAVDTNNYAMAKAFLQSPNCDVNAKDVTKLCPIHVAAIHANVKIASLLVRHGAHVDVPTVRGSTPLILACKSASYETARLLLLNGANPNHAGLNGHTPISAVLECCPDRLILDILIEAGAGIDRADIRKCQKEKLPLLKLCPDVLETLKILASAPRSLKMLCCLGIRKCLLASHSRLHLMLKVQQLPLPNIVREFLLLNHL